MPSEQYGAQTDESLLAGSNCSSTFNRPSRIVVVNKMTTENFLNIEGDGPQAQEDKFVPPQVVLLTMDELIAVDEVLHLAVTTASESFTIAQAQIAEKICSIVSMYEREKYESERE